MYKEGTSGMRITRVEKFRKFRGRQLRNRLLYTAVLPFISVFLGYLITSLVILPTMKK
jgi:polyferredoxin